MKQSLDVVFLIPGFLGFDQFRDFAYFADRVGAALRAALSQRLRRQILVVPVPIPPTSSLAQRQLALGKTLVARARALGRSRQREVSGVHLVGHSTGGVDAQLLSLEVPLSRRDWRDFDGTDVTWLRDRLKSIVSIASPHQGTCLAQSPLAKALVSGSLAERLRLGPAALHEGVSVLLRTLQSLPELARDPDSALLFQSLASTTQTLRFLRELVASHDLIADLAPEKSVGRYAKLGVALNVHRRSFVTVAGVTPDVEHSAATRATDAPPPPERQPAKLDEAKNEPPDALFLMLAELSSGRRQDCASDLLPNSIERLREAQANPEKIIAGSPRLLPHHFDGAVNDGVVNSARQLIAPDDRDELAAIVVADHFDVVGHYDRSIWISDPETGDESEKSQVAGLLHSGSRFRDDQFFELVQRISDAMAPAF